MSEVEEVQEPVYTACVLCEQFVNTEDTITVSSKRASDHSRADGRLLRTKLVVKEWFICSVCAPEDGSQEAAIKHEPSNIDVTITTHTTATEETK